jgi:hypothetical protein
MVIDLGTVADNAVPMIVSTRPSSRSGGVDAPPDAFTGGAEVRDLGREPQAQPRSFFLGFIGTNVTSSTLAPAREKCLKSSGWLINWRTRRQWPAPCNTLSCGYCLPRLAARRQLVLAESMPDTMWSQTLVCSADEPDPWPIVRHRMNEFFKFYRRRASLRELSYVVEMNPAATGYHVHALCHGPKWDVDALRIAQAQAQLGLHGNQWQEISDRHGAAEYGMKGFRAAGYGLKGYGNRAQAREALRINGGRLEHHTRGFIRVAGKPASIKAAETSIRRKKFGGSKDITWRAEPFDQPTFERWEPAGPQDLEVLWADTLSP